MLQRANDAGDPTWPISLSSLPPDPLPNHAAAAGAQEASVGETSIPDAASPCAISARHMAYLVGLSTVFPLVKAFSASNMLFI